MSWTPGDEIPGWEDAECPTVSALNRFGISYPTPWRAIGTIDATRGASDVASFSIVVADCEEFTCSSSWGLGPWIPGVHALVENSGETGLRRGVGDYGPDADPLRSVAGWAVTVVGTMANGGTGDPNAEVRACIERSRPDEIAGVVYFQLGVQGDPFLNYQYGTAEFWFPFRILLADHAGVLLDKDVVLTSANGDVLPVPGLDAAVKSFHWRYVGVDYDEAWPWEEITDKSVRDEVYARYTPLDLRSASRLTPTPRTAR